MKTRNLISVVLLIIFWAVPIFAQNVKDKKLSTKTVKTEKTKYPDLSGMWMLDYSNSRFEKFTQAIHRKIENFNRVFTVEHQSNTLKTTEKNSWSWLDKNSDLPNSAEAINIYFTDNRGEINTVGTEKFRTKTKWVGNKLVITHFTSGEFVQIEPYATTQVSLSEDKLIWHYKMIAESKQEEEELKDLETYLVFVRKKE